MTFRDFKLLVVPFVTQATIKSPPNRYPAPGIAEEAHGVKTWKNPRSAEGETSHKVRAASFAVKLETSWITWGYQKKEYPKGSWYNTVCILYSSEILVVHVTFGLFWSECDLPLYYGWWKFMWQLVEETWTASIPRSGFLTGFYYFWSEWLRLLNQHQGMYIANESASGYDMSVCLSRFLQWPVFLGDAMVFQHFSPEVGHLKGSVVWIEQNLWCESKREILASKLWLRFREFFLTNMISKRKYAAENSHQLLPCQACGGRNS